MNPLNKFRNTYLVPPWIDHHTVEHTMRGAVIAFVFQHFLSFWWIISIVAGVSITHEIIIYYKYGWKPYKTVENWAKNTTGDLVFEIGIGGLVAL